MKATTFKKDEVGSAAAAKARDWREQGAGQGAGQGGRPGGQARGQRNALGGSELVAACSASRQGGGVGISNLSGLPWWSSASPPPSHWREFCHFADALSPSLLKHLLKVEGGAAE